jgi:hypothetical protein
MRTIAFILTCTLVGGIAFAGPLKKEHVAADAKWLIHLDVENLLGTQIGSFLANEILDKQWAKYQRDFKKELDIDLDWRKVHSLTAYGTDFQSSAQDKGVLLIQSRLDLVELLDAIIAKKPQLPLKKLQDESFPLYALGNDVFGSPAGGDVFLLSKSKPQMEKARNVFMRKAANLTSSKAFPAFAEAPKGFLVATAADGFGSATKLPSQANALKSAEGGQVVAGEKADNFFLNFALTAKDTESATQMQQMFQGMIALVALSQNENKELQQLVQGTKVGSVDKVVTLNLELPASEVIAKVNKEQKKRTK